MQEFNYIRSALITAVWLRRGVEVEVVAHIRYKCVCVGGWVQEGGSFADTSVAHFHAN